MRDFWPCSEASQADYEALRAAALGAVVLIGAAAKRFERAGLAGLVVHPVADPVFNASVHGALRPPWTPYGDPRGEALAASYSLLLGENERLERAGVALDQGFSMAQGGQL